MINSKRGEKHGKKVKQWILRPLYFIWQEPSRKINLTGTNIELSHRLTQAHAFVHKLTNHELNVFITQFLSPPWLLACGDICGFHGTYPSHDHERERVSMILECEEHTF